MAKGHRGGEWQHTVECLAAIPSIQQLRRISFRLFPVPCSLGPSVPSPCL